MESIFSIIIQLFSTDIPSFFVLKFTIIYQKLKICKIDFLSYTFQWVAAAYVKKIEMSLLNMTLLQHNKALTFIKWDHLIIDTQRRRAKLPMKGNALHQLLRIRKWVRLIQSLMETQESKIQVILSNNNPPLWLVLNTLRGIKRYSFGWISHNIIEVSFSFIRFDFKMIKINSKRQYMTMI